jgi:hypothetical protein
MLNYTKLWTIFKNHSTDARKPTEGVSPLDANATPFSCVLAPLRFISKLGILCASAVGASVKEYHHDTRRKIYV